MIRNFIAQGADDDGDLKNIRVRGVVSLRPILGEEKTSQGHLVQSIDSKVTTKAQKVKVTMW